jgi:hypothetical protein
MSPYQASASRNPNKTGKTQTDRNMTIGLMATAAVIIILFSGALCSNLASSGSLNGETAGYVPKPYAETVVSGQIVVNAEGFYCVAFVVPEGALNAVLHGSFVSTGNATNRCVMVTVWSSGDFANWLCSRQCSPPEYNKDLMPMVAGNINVTLPSGIHYIYIGSASYMQAQTVSAQIDLTYSK